jgi:hypothetical protein
VTLAIEWARPAALWALLLAAPIVAVHLYRRRRLTVPVAFVALLRETPGAVATAGLWRRLLDGANLVVRLLALACLVLALAGPRPAEAATVERDLVIVLDGDVTTLAIERSRRTRFAEQVALAHAHVVARRGGRTAILLALDAPRALAAPTDDRPTLLRALDRAEPGLGPADLGAAVRAARETAAEMTRARVLVISSRPVPGEEGDPAVEVLGAGTASDDQGFVDQRVVPSDDGSRWEVSLRVRNFAREARRRTVVCEEAVGPEIGRREVALPPRGEAGAAFSVLPPKEGAFVRVRLEGSDDFAPNDDAAAWLAPFPRPSVLVVHGGRPRPFVGAVLDAMGDRVDPERSGSVLARDLAKAAPRDVVVFDGVAPPAGSAVEGAWILLAPFGDPAAWPKDAPVRPRRDVVEPLVWRADESHALLRGVDLSTAYVVRATTLSGDDATATAYVEGEPVVLEGERGRLRWIAFGLDPEGSDLPLRAALPVLIQNAIRRLATSTRSPLRPFYKGGEPLRPRVPLPGGGPFHVFFDEPPPRTPRDKLLYPGWTLERLGPDDAAARPAPRMGTLDVTVVAADGSRYRSAIVDLDPTRDITPVRPAATPPPPAALPAESPADRWRAVLLAAAGALLLLDVALAAGTAYLGTRRLARAAPGA